MNSALLKHNPGLGATTVGALTGANAFYPRRPGGKDLAATAGFFSLLRKTAALARVWLERSRQRTDLRRLDGRMLSDIGLSRSQALHEGSKPFWRA